MAGFRTPRRYTRNDTTDIQTSNLEQCLYDISLATDIVDARAFGGLDDITIAPSKEQMITAAIQYAAATGKSMVFVPKSMLPYNAGAVTTNASVQIIWEGSDYTFPILSTETGVVAAQYPYGDVRRFGAAVGAAAAINGAAFANAVAWASAAGYGAKVIIPPGGTYDFDTQIAPTSGIIIEGGIAGPNNAGDRQGPVLNWTGGATAAIYISGVGCENLQLRGFGLNNSGSGTIGIQIETGRVRLKDVGIVAPTVPFSTYGISVGLNGGTTPGCAFDDVTLRESAPINLKLARIGGFLFVKGGALMDPSAGGVMSVQVGDVSSSLRADYVHFLGTTFESTTTDAANIQVLRSTQLTILDCYFEVSGANAVALDIPNTAGKAQGVFMSKCRMGAITGSPYAVRSDFASAILDIDSCNFEGTWTGIFDNRNVRHARIAHNVYNGSSPVWANSPKNVTKYLNRETGSGAPNAAVRDDGYFVEKEKTDTTSTGNVGTTETDLISYTLPSNRIYENGQTIEITVWGTTAANANGKQAKLYIGGVVVLDSTSLAANNKSWFMKATLIRTSATAGIAMAEGSFNGSAIQPVHIGVTVASTGWDAAQIIKVTGTGAASNDILQKGLYVKVSN